MNKRSKHSAHLLMKMFREFLWTWLPWIMNKTNDLLSKTYSIFRVAYNEATIKKEWIFIKNNFIPVCSENFEAIPDHTINWRCSLNPTSFVEPGIIAKEKHLSYLAFTVIAPGEIIDLSSWVNEVKWQGTYEPTIKEIFILWSCEKGKSYFHCLDQIEIEVITELGDSMRVTL